MLADATKEELFCLYYKQWISVDNARIFAQF